MKRGYTLEEIAKVTKREARWLLIGMWLTQLGMPLGLASAIYKAETGYYPFDVVGISNELASNGRQPVTEYGRQIESFLERHHLSFPYFTP